MNTLHIVRNLEDLLPFELLLQNKTKEEQTLLLIHDAVYHRGPFSSRSYASTADLAARGILSSLPLLTDLQICQMILDHQRTIVW